MSGAALRRRGRFLLAASRRESYKSCTSYWSYGNQRSIPPEFRQARKPDLRKSARETQRHRCGRLPNRSKQRCGQCSRVRMVPLHGFPPVVEVGKDLAIVAAVNVIESQDQRARRRNRLVGGRRKRLGCRCETRTRFEFSREMSNTRRPAVGPFDEPQHDLAELFG